MDMSEESPGCGGQEVGKVEGWYYIPVSTYSFVSPGQWILENGPQAKVRETAFAT